MPPNPVQPLPAGGDVQFVIATTPTRPISRFIYGTNVPARLAELPGQLTVARVGGTVYSLYSWETNYTNGGVTNGQSNTAALITGLSVSGPAAPALAALAQAQAAGAGTVVTVPALGWVAADADGVVSPDEPVGSRFLPSLPLKGAPFAATPDLHDGVVFEDEFVAYITARFPNAETSPSPIFFCIDNEPGFWAPVFPRAHPDGTTYAEAFSKNITYARMVKSLVPGALVFGLVEYGGIGFDTMQLAPDRNAPQFAGRTAVENYLMAMRDAEQSEGERLIDVLDIHWFPEAVVDGVRITEYQSTPALAQARVQAPRALWDPTYTETNAFDHQLHSAIQLLPNVLTAIDAYYPGTLLAVTEYDYGGSDDISGAMAVADVLGIFGSEGVFLAALWEAPFRDYSYAYAGFTMYRNFDGQGGQFGDLSLPATTTDVEATSVYASLDSQRPDRMVVVVLNKTEQALSADLQITGDTFTRAEAYELTAAGAQPVAGGPVTQTDVDRFGYTIPPMSVATLVFSR